MKLIKGENLTVEQIKEVKRRFVHRLTFENGCPKRNTCKATIPYIHDDQWIREHAFYVKSNGDLSNKPNHCEPHYLAD